MARPTKLTPDVADAIVKAVGEGLPRRLAAAVAGVSPAAFYTWMRAGRRRGGKAFVQFLERVKKAEAEAVLTRVRQVHKAADISWQAAAWWLERTHPEEFGRDREQIQDLARQLRELTARLTELRKPLGEVMEAGEGPSE